MAKLVVVALTLALAALLGAARGSAGPVQEVKLIGSVGPEFTISLTDAQGNPVTKLDPGAYEIEVTDRSDFHNFHLTGPGVSEDTGVEFTGQVTWHVTFRDGSYVYVCDVHPSSMRGTFTAGTPPDHEPASSGRRRWRWQRGHGQDEAPPHLGSWVRDHAEDGGRQDRQVDADRDVHARRPRSRAHPQRPRRRAGLQPPDDAAHLHGDADLEGEAGAGRDLPLTLRPACGHRHEGVGEDRQIAAESPSRRRPRSGRLQGFVRGRESRDSGFPVLR